MDEAASIVVMTQQQDHRISEVVAQHGSRLRNFIRQRVPNNADAEDLVQEVFYESVEANRLLMPIEYVTGWLFQVARNRITDLFRKSWNFGGLCFRVLGRRFFRPTLLYVDRSVYVSEFRSGRRY
jgi:DNA-directed RNA polymerase specialized sigma24 family protein